MKIPLLQDKLEYYFKWFHQHPEPSNQEFETTKRIREILREEGIEIVETAPGAELKTGLVARIQGKAGTPVVALRCDIDALPINEESGLPYSSLNHGFMHACGHDFHTTSLLGAALLLNEERETLNGTVKLLFQPAEEGGDGALQVIESHILDDVSEIYGIHVAAGHENGLIGISPGATHAAVGIFSISIKGKGSHGAAPHYARDPIVAAAQLINTAQVIVSRNTDPFDQAVVSFTHIKAGSTWNVIPEEAWLEGTLRAFSDEKLSWLAERLRECCNATEKAMGLRIDLNYRVCTVATNNDPELSEFAAETARSLGLTVVASQRAMGGEDFALYQKIIPGVFWTIGINSPQGVHHPGFIADMSRLAAASSLFTALAQRSLARLSKKK
ncbi:MAG: amidohydrolase [Spirochaetaceae bacterium]|jgi:amidohydrolase|nr:amidohydrolase [Spirochaetaceae bacterium]